MCPHDLSLNILLNEVATLMSPIEQERSCDSNSQCIAAVYTDIRLYVGLLQHSTDQASVAVQKCVTF